MDENITTEPVDRVDHLFALHRVLIASENYLADLDPDSSLAVAKARESIYDVTQICMNGSQKQLRDAHGNFDRAIRLLEKLPKGHDTNLIHTLVPMIEILKIAFAEKDS